MRHCQVGWRKCRSFKAFVFSLPCYSSSEATPFVRTCRNSSETTRSIFYCLIWQIQRRKRQTVTRYWFVLLEMAHLLPLVAPSFTCDQVASKASILLGDALKNNLTFRSRVPSSLSQDSFVKCIPCGVSNPQSTSSHLVLKQQASFLVVTMTQVRVRQTSPSRRHKNSFDSNQSWNSEAQLASKASQVCSKLF